MKRVEGVENVDILNIGTQGIVGVGASTHTFTASFRPEGYLRTTAVGCIPGIRSSCR
jgi:hypothetical protein